MNLYIVAIAVIIALIAIYQHQSKWDNLRKLEEHRAVLAATHAKGLQDARYAQLPTSSAGKILG